jgi:methyltransferase (TIGR00027 family)
MAIGFTGVAMTSKASGISRSVAGLESGQPSRTALAAAAHRAAHQVLEGGAIFTDRLAIRILGLDAETVAREAREHPSRRLMRLFIAVRTRFAEDALAAARERGVSQVVILGAGLDTYAYRTPLPAADRRAESAVGGGNAPRMRIFEVDHPATQAWKRERLAAAGIEPPDNLIFAPIDFERQTLAEGLAWAGFDPAQQAFFTWLGVVPYLTEEAVWLTLSYIGRLSMAHVVFDYSDPPESLSPAARLAYRRRAARVSALGEAWLTHFEPPRLHARLAELGFAEIEDLGPAQIRARYFPGGAGSGSENGGHVLRASTVRLG